MLKPDSPFQASAVMTDSLEFIKKLWGGMGIPGTMPSGMMGMSSMVLPTFSVEELRKKISELRAVESWLELNTNMLRTTIQALEVQAATISTLQSMGNNLQAATQAAVAPFNTENTAKETAWPQPDGHAEKEHGFTEPNEQDEADAAAFTAPLVNAATWWNHLQGQFQQAVSQALTEPPKPSRQARSSTSSSTKSRKSTATKSAATKSTATKSAARKRKSTK